MRRRCRRKVELRCQENHQSPLRLGTLHLHQMARESRAMLHLPREGGRWKGTECHGTCHTRMRRRSTEMPTNQEFLRASFGQVFVWEDLVSDFFLLSKRCNVCCNVCCNLAACGLQSRPASRCLLSLREGQEGQIHPRK